VFVSHFARAPKPPPPPPPPARLATPLEGAVHAALGDGRLSDADALYERLARALAADGVEAPTRRGFGHTLEALVRSGHAVEVSGYRLDGVVGR
jgi:hypothetical protein